MTQVAIVMATYNGEKYISEQIDSLLLQTHTDWTLYIHDDNSTDDTIDIVREYASKYQNKIIYIDDDVSYNGAATNFLGTLKIVNTNGFDYFMFCDQDDVWLDNKIELSVDIISAQSNQYPLLLHTDLKIVDKKLNIISESMWKYQKINYMRTDYNYYVMFNNVTGCTAMFNQQAKLLIENYHVDFIYMHDWWTAQVVSANGRVISFNEPTILYRQHDNNSLGASEATKSNYFTMLLSKFVRLSFASGITRIKLMNKNVKRVSYIVFFIEHFKHIIFKLKNR